MRTVALILTLLLLVSCKNEKQAPQKPKTIVSQIPFAVALLKELTKDTQIKVISLADRDMTIDELSENTKKREAEIDSLAGEIAAVVSLHSILQNDGLYIAVRNSNIRTVEIDLVDSKNLNASSVGVIRSGKQVNPYIWLSVANLMQMSEILHLDLVALFPEDSTTITNNHKKLHTELKTLKSTYEKKFLSLPRFDAATMDNSFDYFIQDINLFVIKRFKNETAWTVDDKKTYEKAVQSGDFATIIHRWKPLSSVSKVAEENKVNFTVLSTGFPGMDHFDKGLLPFMESNLESLVKNLEKK